MRDGLGRKKSIKALIVIFSVVIIALGGALVYYFVQYQHAKNNPKAAAQATTNRLLQKMGKLYQLPAHETPTVAQIQDKNKLNGQPFFSNARNGDYILMYTDAKVAIIYREDENKLINVGPITLNNQTESPTRAK